MILKPAATWEKIAKRFGTPLYYYNGNIIIEQFRKLRTVYPPIVDIYYAFKPNNSLAICQLLQKEGAGADVTSVGEYLLARRAGFIPERMLFTGPGKRSEEIDMTIKEGIGILVVESQEEAERVQTIARKYKKKQKILLRINVNYCTSESGIQLGGGCQKFGVDERYAASVIRQILKKENINFLGIHAISGSLILKHTVLLHAYSYAIKLAEKLIRQGIPIHVVDFGGGLGIPYSRKQKSLDLIKLGKGITELLKGKQFHCIAEVGRFLVGESGAYVTRVIDKKISAGKRFAILDGGTHHILRQYLQWANAFVDVVSRNGNQNNGKERISFGGPLCTPSDFLLRDAPLPFVHIGDILVFQNCGAYAFSTGTALFSAHPLPLEVMELHNREFIIRERGEASDVFLRQKMLSPL